LLGSLVQSDRIELISDLICDRVLSQTVFLSHLVIHLLLPGIRDPLWGIAAGNIPSVRGVDSLSYISRKNMREEAIQEELPLGIPRDALW